MLKIGHLWIVVQVNTILCMNTTLCKIGERQRKAGRTLIPRLFILIQTKAHFMVIKYKVTPIFMEK